MWRTPTREQFERIPKLYATEHIPAEEKIIYLHFFSEDATGSLPSVTAMIFFSALPSSMVIMNRLNGDISVSGN